MSKKSDPNLKGTLYSVLFIGAIIVIMWASIFWLYMERV
ncbi:cytochrome c oxidase subunit 2A [Halobacillus sp. Marseille-Q1614]|nr:cytochrome c oxidase subunit 2A [Halobacillus sp. Marseille-Q1614]